MVLIPLWSVWQGREIGGWSGSDSVHRCVLVLLQEFSCILKVLMTIFMLRLLLHTFTCRSEKHQWSARASVKGSSDVWYMTHLMCWAYLETRLGSSSWTWNPALNQIPCYFHLFPAETEKMSSNGTLRGLKLTARKIIDRILTGMSHKLDLVSSIGKFLFWNTKTLIIYNIIFHTTV